MTEASSKGMTAGPVIGGGAASSKDIVDGLDGLRLLIERRQNEVKTNEQNVAQSSPTLTEKDTILAITGKRPKVYVLEDDKLRVYNSESVNGDTDKLNAAVNRLDFSKFLIRRNRAVAGQRMLVNKSMADELSIVSGGVVYRDYLLKLNTSATEVVKMMLAQQPKKMKATHGEAVPCKVDNEDSARSGAMTQYNNKAEANTRSNSEAAALLDKVASIKKIVDRTAKSEVTPRDAMELFLVMGQASTKVLEDILDLNEEQADSIIDSLRRMGGIGERKADDAYPILISKIDKLVDSDDPRRSQVSFCAAVHREEISGVVIAYDLDEVSRIDWADEFVRCMADYVRASQNPRIRKLFTGDNKQVKLSRILKSLSADNERVDFPGLNRFNEIVLANVLTKSMVSANPTDGFPWVSYQVIATDNLKENTLRYLITNVEWTSAVLSIEQLESLARQIANMPFDEPTEQRRNLQRAASLRYASVVDAMQIESDIAGGQQKITLK